MNEVTITLKEYSELLNKEARIEAFEEYVKNEEYSITRKMCGIFLGFEVKEND